MINFKADDVDWAKGDGLIPAIIQDALSLRVLMLGYVNRASLEATLATGLMTFYSRSQERLWQKGETSGHVLHVKSIKLDCDKDALLVEAEPEGPTCHLGTTTCWGDKITPSLSTLADLVRTIRHRRKNPLEGSYTNSLLEKGVTRIAQKVGEEGVETALAAATGGANLTEEAADLIYHILVLLESTDKSLDDVLAVLQRRAQKGSS